MMRLLVWALCAFMTFLSGTSQAFCSAVGRLCRDCSRLLSMQGSGGRKRRYSSRDRDGFADGDSKKSRGLVSSAPSHFIGVRIKNEVIVREVLKTQAQIIEKAPHLKKCAINADKLHFSLLVLGGLEALEEEELVEALRGVEASTRRAVTMWVSETKALWPSSKERETVAVESRTAGVQDGLEENGTEESRREEEEAEGRSRVLGLTLESLGNFGQRVLFASPCPHSSWLLRTLHARILSELQTDIAASTGAVGKVEIVGEEKNSKNKGKGTTGGGLAVGEKGLKTKSADSLGDKEQQKMVPSETTALLVHQRSNRIEEGDPGGRSSSSSGPTQRETRIASPPHAVDSIPSFSKTFQPHMTIMKTSQGMRRAKSKEEKARLQILPEYWNGAAMGDVSDGDGGGESDAVEGWELKKDGGPRHDHGAKRRKGASPDAENDVEAPAERALGVEWVENVEILQMKGIDPDGYYRRVATISFRSPSN
uniref:A-kinase anchor protein 7-like phosphoesterase domain-containing protein n=1 Tax=Chromera velia CCMP2878 TaxID=1169474 RepID=A0A0G4I9E9_9ALVE|eukprot:Cvel_12136.t1-p1 / transcript=Cvel_12136.t1 / gene=Cvel_12136 / organism=Chromera_velia_CCMP2878 / gene_product=hypothetical protein / transcript_product=hypothetical protein / location=Cvel_scaffold782:13925-18346(-) / protein_length=481 / sequence_SO=supercontig / SO=protein_coding / is_pseudo=false